jgi:fructoselysine-6-P-deglycase FrlB-like protein
LSHLAEEIRSQPAAWRRVPEVVADHGHGLPRPGGRVAVIGCGTSWFMASAYAGARETLGLGETDAFAASEMPAGREYDAIVCITRSGTTTEVLTLLERLRAGDGPAAPTVAITTDPDAPVARAASSTIVLDFADERSVVQTVFATTALMLLRAHLGEDVEPLAARAEVALAAPPEARIMDAEQVTFLGRGAAVGLAQEAALKLREAALAWAEAYPAMEYRHGPISLAQAGRAVWSLGALPPGLAEDIGRTGATLVHHDEDPIVGLVRAQLVAEALAVRRGLDPDRPRHLSRSVTLETS